MTDAVKSSIANRPISPHLSVYKLQATMVMSGLHRITGLGLVMGIPLFAWWILAIAAGPEYFAVTQWFWGAWYGKLCLFGWTFSLFYHLSNGIRHLLWDIGVGLTVPGIKTGGWIMAGSAVALTLLTWAIALTVRS